MQQHFFLLNVFLMVVVVFGVGVTGNPLFALLLLMLRDMPHYPPQYVLAAQQKANETAGAGGPYQTNAIGFTGQVGGGDDDDYQDRQRQRR